jgi:hypothetical protein
MARDKELAPSVQQRIFILPLGCLSMKTTCALKLGLTRESLFEILARSKNRFLDQNFSRDSRETRESKLVARLASCDSHRQKFRSETHEKFPSENCFF